VSLQEMVTGVLPSLSTNSVAVSAKIAGTVVLMKNGLLQGNALCSKIVQIQTD
jgi:hypothetical protein